MEKENETPVAEVKGKSPVQAVVDKMKSRVVDTIENAMNHLSPVKTRTMAREKQLVAASKWTREKQNIMGNTEWKDYPPQNLIGKISSTIQGGIGKISYVRYLEDPESHQALKECSADGLDIGGNIVSHYVEETIAPATPISRETVAVSGCPSAKDAKDNLMKARQNERDRVKRTRGHD